MRQAISTKRTPGKLMTASDYRIKRKAAATPAPEIPGWKHLPSSVVMPQQGAVRLAEHPEPESGTALHQPDCPRFVASYLEMLTGNFGKMDLTDAQMEEKQERFWRKSDELEKKRLHQIKLKINRTAMELYREGEEADRQEFLEAIADYVESLRGCNTAAA